MWMHFNKLEKITSWHQLDMLLRVEEPSDPFIYNNNNNNNSPSL